MPDLKIDINDLTLNEIDAIEDEFGKALAEIDFTVAKSLRFLVWQVLKRDNPDATLEDAGNIRPGDIAGEEPDPTPARKGRAAGGRSSAK